MSNEDNRYGTVHHLPDGQVQVRFERLLPYPIEVVWAALTEQEQYERLEPPLARRGEDEIGVVVEDAAVADDDLMCRRGADLLCDLGGEDPHLGFE